MSLYKDASLVMIPSAYKDGKLYSIRPTDGSGDFTFSRGSNLAATRVDVNGLIEKGRENLFLHSNNFSDAEWDVKSGTFSQGVSDPNGGSNAWSWTAVNTAPYLYQRLTPYSGISCLSIWVKGVGSTIGANFQVRGGSANPIKTITLTSDWQRVEHFGDYSANPFVGFEFGIPAVTGDVVHIYQAQYEQGLVATDYIETGASTAQAGILEDMPRLDYSGGASCPALLLEPQRTNTFLNSEYLSVYQFARTNGTNNSTMSPEGIDNAFKLYADTQTGAHYMRLNYTKTSDAVLSVFAKKGEETSFAIGNATGSQAVVFNLNDGTITSEAGGTGTIEDMGSGWYRCSYHRTTWADWQYIALRGNQTSYAGDGSSGLYLYGIQFEDGSYPTSYIPTYGSSVTRSAEEYCKVNNIGEFPNEYTLFFEMEDVEAEQNNSVVMDLYSTTANTISVRTYETSGDGRLRFVDIVNNSTLFYLEHTSRKYCVRVNGTSVDGFTNGTLVSSATAGSSMNNLDDLNIRCGSSQRSSTKYKQLVVFPTALTDSECIALTTL